MYFFFCRNSIQCVEFQFVENYNLKLIYLNCLFYFESFTFEPKQCE